MKNILKIASIICIIPVLLQANSVADSLFLQAQKLYSQGNFEEAAKAYGNVCVQQGAKEKKACLLKEIKSLIEIKKTETLNTAEKKLLDVLSQTEPSDSLYIELNTENVKLQIMLEQPARAIRSWNAAQISASTDYFSDLFVLCQDIVSAYPGNGLNSENCNKIKPADTSLISLPRKKIVPLSIAAVSKTAAHNAPNFTAIDGKWYVQLGAFGNRENAEKLVEDFKSKGVQLYIAQITNKNLFAVRSDNFESKKEAETFAEQKIAPSHKDYRIAH